MPGNGHAHPRTVLAVAFVWLLAACTSAAPDTTPRVATATGTPSNATPPAETPIPGCLPQCWVGQLTRPGPISGDYSTVYFFGGQMTVTVPDGWYGYEDSTGELAIGHPDDESARLEFWIDVYAASDPAGTQDPSIERTGEAVVAWFVDKPIIDVVERAPTTLGGIPAESIEYRRNEDGANEDPDCPAEIQPCAVEFGYPEWDGTFSEGDAFHSQLIVANAVWGGEHHSIYAMFWAIGPAYDAQIEEARAIIDSVTLPLGVEAP